MGLTTRDLRSNPVTTVNFLRTLPSFSSLATITAVPAPRLNLPLSGLPRAFGARGNNNDNDDDDDHKHRRHRRRHCLGRQEVEVWMANFLSFWSIVRKGEKRVNFVAFWPTVWRKSGSRGEDAVGQRRRWLGGDWWW